MMADANGDGFPQDDQDMQPDMQADKPMLVQEQGEWFLKANGITKKLTPQEVQLVEAIMHHPHPLAAFVGYKIKVLAARGTVIHPDGTVDDGDAGDSRLAAPDADPQAEICQLGRAQAADYDAIRGDGKDD